MNTAIHAAQGTLPALFETLYTVPTGRNFIIKAITIANDTAAAVSLGLRVTFPAGGTPVVLVPDRTVAPKETDLAPELINHVMESGGIIEGQGLGLAYAISGILVNA